MTDRTALQFSATTTVSALDMYRHCYAKTYPVERKELMKLDRPFVRRKARRLSGDVKAKKEEFYTPRERERRQVKKQKRSRNVKPSWW